MITLVPFVDSDISDEYIQWLSNRHLMKYSQQSKEKQSFRTANKYIELLREDGGELYKIIYGEKQKFIGTVSLRRINATTVDIGILIGDDMHRGKGLGKAVWNNAVELAFKVPEIECVSAGTHKDNVSMLNIIKASGMKLVEIKNVEGEEFWYFRLSRFAKK